MTFKLPFVGAVAALALMGIAGCGDGGRSSNTTATATATTPSPTTTASTGNITAACQAYLSSVQTCLNHVSAQDPAAMVGNQTAGAASAQVRQTLDGARDQISRTDHAWQDEVCISGANAWTSRKEIFGC